MANKQTIHKFDFQTKYSFDKRKAEYDRIKNKYPDRCPIICEAAKWSKEQIKIDKTKYLVPSDLNIGQLIYILRKRINLLPEQGLFIFTENGQLPASSMLIELLANEHKNMDGFLYLTISLEKTFC